MCHVLVIEDGPLIANLIGRTLGEVGVTSFDVATTEREAIDLARRRIPTVITADVALREGTGPSAVGAIRETLGKVPVIFITGYAQPADRSRFPGPILRKPITRDRLITVFCTISVPPIGERATIAMARRLAELH